MAENMSTLQDTLGTVPTLLGGLGKRRSPEARGKFAAEKYPEALRGQAEAAFEEATQKGAAKEAGIRGEAVAERGLAQTMREDTRQLERGLKPYEEFKAPEYKASDYAADAAKRLVIGLLMGGVSKLSAEGQLRATKAMQDAEDQGLQEQFMQAKLSFDEGEKTRQDHNKNLKERFGRLKELAVQDRTAAAVEAKLLAAQMESGSIAASLRSGNYLKAIKQFEDAMKTEDQFRLEKLKAAQKANRPGQLPSTLQKTLESTGKSRIAMNRAFTNKKDEYFGLAPNDAVAGLILSAVEKGIPVGDFGKQLGFDLPEVKPETVNWWKDYTTFVALVRNELFGATLTKAEQEAFRQFTISPATDPKVVDEYFKNQLDVLDKAARRERAKAEAFGASDRLIDAYLDVTPRERTPQARPPAAGGPRPPEFASEDELNAAAARREIDDGDEVIVGGVRGRYRKETADGF